MELYNTQKYLQKFKEEELNEIRSYIRVHVPYAILNDIYPLTEKFDDKIKVFITQYRILYSIQQLVSNQETKLKINEILEELKDIYYNLYKLFLNKNITLNYGKSLIDRKIINIFQNQDSNDKINSLCSLFLVFSEVIEPINFNTVTAVNMETPEGQKLYKDIMAKDKHLEEIKEELPPIEIEQEVTEEVKIENEETKLKEEPMIKEKDYEDDASESADYEEEPIAEVVEDDELPEKEDF